MHFKGRVQLVSVKALVSPHLKYRPGLTKWEVYHKKKSSHHPQAWYHNWAEVPEQRRDALQQSMFHEVYTDQNHQQELPADPLHLSRCIRLYPHDDNQGGFFVALFVRLADDPSPSESNEDPWINEKLRLKPVLEDL